MSGLVSARGLADLLGDTSGDRSPRYTALAGRVRLLVADGRLPVGLRLPAERDLASALGVSRATVTAAYARLRADGWATARQGAGTWTALPAGSGTAAGPWVPGPVEEGVLDLAHAAPPAPPAVAAAYAAALDELPRLLPGHGYHPQGLPELRARVAERYTARGLPTAPEQVLVTNGALHGVTVALEALFRRGQRLLVEHPTYPNALDAARARGLRPLPVAVELAAPEESVDRVARTLVEARPAGAYLMPDFANPTGLLLDAGQRERLARALHRSGTVAVVDETLVDLGLDVEPGPPLAAYGGGHVSVGTLSKSFWGGLRVGWVRAEADAVQRLTSVALRTQMSGPALEQLAACHLLDHADSALAEARDRLRTQRDVLVHALRAQLPDWEVPVPPGGLVLWCRLPAPRSSALTTVAPRYGLRLVAGARFGTGHAFEDRVRLPYTWPPEVLRRAVRWLVEADAAAEHDRPARGLALPVI